MPFSTVRGRDCWRIVFSRLYGIQMRRIYYRFIKMYDIWSRRYTQPSIFSKPILVIIMTNIIYYLQSIVNVLLSITYILGGLVFLFPNKLSIIQPPFDMVAIGIVLFTTGIFGSPYCTFYKKE
jgi:hypothetical protein